MARFLYRICCLLALLLPAIAQANCSSTTLRGESAVLYIDINDCERERKVIQVGIFAPNVEGGVIQPLVPFDSQCRMNARGMKCRADGKTVLAGSAYRYTNDTNPSCEGSNAGRRLTCVAGCNPRLPKYLYLVEYSC